MLNPQISPHGGKTKWRPALSLVQYISMHDTIRTPRTFGWNAPWAPEPNPVGMAADVGGVGGTADGRPDGGYPTPSCIDRWKEKIDKIYIAELIYWYK